MIYISGLPPSLSLKYFLQMCKKTKEKKLRRRPSLDLRFFLSRRQIFALSSNCCRNFKWLLRGEVVYTIAIANATEVRIGLVRTYHLHFSRQLFVQRIEYIALLLRRSPANSVVGRYDIIAMNYSKP